MQRIQLVLLGPPAAGKGTYATKLSTEYDIAYISVGELLRGQVAQGTELGRQAKGYMDRGVLVPDELIVDMLKERLAQEDCAKGFVLDGFPRSLGQLSILGEAVQGAYYAINLDEDKEVLLRRVQGRRTCESCKAIYNIFTNKPKTEGVCDICGGTLTQRDDDNVKTLEERINVYNTQTIPVLGELEKQGALINLKPDEDIEVMYATIKNIVESVLAGRNPVAEAKQINKQSSPLSE